MAQHQPCLQVGSFGRPTLMAGLQSLLFLDVSWRLGSCGPKMDHFALVSLGFWMILDDLDDLGAGGIFAWDMFIKLVDFEVVLVEKRSKFKGNMWK